MFGRRNPRSWARLAAETVWPQAGWRRAGTYVLRRLQRLPDSPRRIARGVFAGVFVSFLPCFGVHMPMAALVSLPMRGNILAAVLGTMIGNPLTFPAIAWIALETGYRVMGGEGTIPVSTLVGAFGAAGTQLWHNAQALLLGGPMQWDDLAQFWRAVFLPYTVGGAITGTLAGLASYAVSLPLIARTQTRRAAALRIRTERRLAARAHALALAEAAERARTARPPRPQDGMR